MRVASNVTIELSQGHRNIDARVIARVKIKREYCTVKQYSIK